MLVTGIQPTGGGGMHLGNYFGAIKPLIALQNKHESFVFVADYHAITASFDPQKLATSRLQMAAMILACGYTGNLFYQSDVPEHFELAHILGCTAARVGQLTRMVQFKEKMETLGENSEGPSVGLLTYPVLQAADILLYQDYKPTVVPVGADQAQHLNLVIDIAQSFNHRFGPTFHIPEALISRTPRIMSLQNGRQKMSKSAINDMSRLNMTDSNDQIKKKIRKATSDTALIDNNLADRPELRNLLTIYAAGRDLTVNEAALLFSGHGFGKLKEYLTDVIISLLEPIRERYTDFMSDPTQIETTLLNGAEHAQKIASQTLDNVRQAIGVS